MESTKVKVGDEMGTIQAREQDEVLVSIPITQSALSDISNIIGSRKSSSWVEKVKRIRKKDHAQLVENVTPRVVKKSTKRLAFEGDHSELPNKKRMVSCFG